jgi:hypothetical protein
MGAQFKPLNQKWKNYQSPLMGEQSPSSKNRNITKSPYMGAQKPHNKKEALSLPQFKV